MEKVQLEENFVYHLIQQNLVVVHFLDCFTQLSTQHHKTSPHQNLVLPRGMLNGRYALQCAIVICFYGR